MVERDYTYWEMRREKTTLLLNNLVRELTSQGKFQFYEEDGSHLDSGYTTDLVMEGIYGLNDQNYDIFINKLIAILLVDK